MSGSDVGGGEPPRTDHRRRNRSHPASSLADPGAAPLGAGQVKCTYVEPTFAIRTAPERPDVMTSAYVYAAARTPFGKFNGAFADVRPDDLAASAILGVLARTPALDPGTIDDVVWGNANGAGEENRNVGRMAVLRPGLPVSVPGTTVNRLCGSSLDAAMSASRTIESGDAEVVLTG